MHLRTTVGQRRRILSLLLGSALLTALAPSVAGAACPTSSAAVSFAQFGDSASYSLAPGGSFESGAPGWSLSNAAVTSGNESFNVVAGSHSMAIEAGGLAVSPRVCVSSEYPSFRFFVRRTGGSGSSTLSATLRWMSVLGLSVETPAGSVVGGSSWAPSPVMKLGDSVPLWLPGSTLETQLVFRASSGGSWVIDDLFIDPYRR